MARRQALVGADREAGNAGATWARARLALLQVILRLVWLSLRGVSAG